MAESALRRVDPARAWALSVPLRRLMVSPSLEWFGNVRQLERAVERARDRAVSRDLESTILTPEHFETRDLDNRPLDEGPAAPDELGAAWQRLQGERTKLDEREQGVLRDALKKAGGVVAHAARDLGIARTTLSSRLEALGIRSPRRD